MAEVSLIEAIKNAESLAEDGQLRQDRITMLDQYLGQPYGNEVTGRSQVVDRTIQNTVEWIKPQLLKIFCSGDEVVKFNPIGPKDDEAAKQETDYVNWVATQKNNFFTVCYESFTDALIQRNGYIKAWYDEAEDETKEEYEGLAPEELALILQDPTCEVIKKEIEDGPFPAISVTVKRVKDTGQIRIQAIAPEQILVTHNANGVSLQDACFVEHWEWKTLSEIRLMGFKVDDDIADGGEEVLDQQFRGRQSEWWQSPQDESVDPSMRRVKFREVWIRYDDDEDGKAELIHAFVIGQEVLEQEEVEFIPIASLTPQAMPHRHHGMSIADAVDDLQLIKTTLLRGMLDNLYLSVHGRYAIDVDRVNLEDMLTSRPGGLVRVQGDPGTAVIPMLHQANYQPIMDGLAYIDEAAERRTGVNKTSQGLESNSLNKTATATQAMLSTSQEKILLIARAFAEVGIKDLFWIIHAMTRKYVTRQEMINVRGSWVPVDPRTWFKRTDMTVSVGLGTGNKAEQLAHLQTLLLVQQQALQIGIATPENIYNAATKLVEAAGFRSPEQYFTDPKTQPPKPPQQDPQMMVKQMELQADAQKFQAQTQAAQAEAQQKAQLDIQKFQATHAIEQQKAERDYAQEQLRSQNDVAIEQAKISAQMELERYKAQLQAETQLQIAQLQLNLEHQKLQHQVQADVWNADLAAKQHELNAKQSAEPKHVVLTRK
jgi:hypothetical protein